MCLKLERHRSGGTVKITKNRFCYRHPVVETAVAAVVAVVEVVVVVAVVATVIVIVIVVKQK
jgi:hypothetical protein